MFFETVSALSLRLRSAAGNEGASQTAQILGGSSIHQENKAFYSKAGSGEAQRRTQIFPTEKPELRSRSRGPSKTTCSELKPTNPGQSFHAQALPALPSRWLVVSARPWAGYVEPESGARRVQVDGLGAPPGLPERVSALGKATFCSQIFPHRQSKTELSLERSFKNSLFRTEAGPSNRYQPPGMSPAAVPSGRVCRNGQEERFPGRGAGFSSEQAVFEGPLERELSFRVSMGKNLAARSGLSK
jgi:hypothetical protein